jgi:hypothetical protein
MMRVKQIIKRGREVFDAGREYHSVVGVADGYMGKINE